MATSYYFLNADWRSSTDTPYIPYGNDAFKNVYNQDYLSNHSYLFYNGGSSNNKKDETGKTQNIVKSPYIYSYLKSYSNNYDPDIFSKYSIKVGGNKNKINELKHRNMMHGEPLVFSTKDIVGPNPCFQPYTFTNNAAIDSYFLPSIDKDLPPVNYYQDGGNNLKNKNKNKNKNKKNKNKHKLTKKKALKNRFTKKYKNNYK